MKSKSKFKLKVLLYIDIAILLLLISYKCYLYAFERDFHSININGIKEIQNHVSKEKSISFAVLGNIENSIDIFNKRIIRSINNDKDIDFVISTGDAVLDGVEDKYRILNKSINKLDVPMIAGIGDSEISDGGAFRYYKHFGPFYYSFSVADSYFIFLDTTGKTSEKWQKDWLENEFKHSSKFKHKFVVLNKPPYKVKNKSFTNDKTQYIKDPKYRRFLRKTFSKYKVEAVFSSGLEIFDKRKIDGVQYYISGGGGGGLILNDNRSFFHYLKVNENRSSVQYNVIKEENPPAFFLRRPLENIWIYIHSIFYINFLNFFLILCLLAFLGILIYLKISKEVNYYRDFNQADNYPEKDKLKIAMFTNNYFPFIGGVPISIYRLAKGLRKSGHAVYIFAPKYPGVQQKRDPFIIRCNLLTYYKTKIFEYAVVNIFSLKIDKEFVAHDFDVIHVHHPFWMGRKGLSLGKKYKIPVVFTYHTRLDSYYHYIPFMKLLFKNILSHKIIKRFAQKCNAVFAPTYTAKEYLSNIGVSRHTSVLPTGVNFEYYDSISSQSVKLKKESFVSEDEILLCSVSRLSKEKNIYFLIEAIHYIKKNTTVPFKCIIIGDGPEKENIMKLIQANHLQDSIKLVGSVKPEEISEYYMASDIFIFGSKSETQGMVLLEAMAGKCPVVAVSSSGIDDVIKNDYNGYKTAEDIELWSQKVIYLLSNQKKLKEMSQNAYHFSKGFSVEAMAIKACKVYRKAIKDNHNKLINIASIEEILKEE